MKKEEIYLFPIMIVLIIGIILFMEGVVWTIINAVTPPLDKMVKIVMENSAKKLMEIGGVMTVSSILIFFVIEWVKEKLN